LDGEVRVRVLRLPYRTVADKAHRND
jgi:hypothetical protein